MGMKEVECKMARVNMNISLSVETRQLLELRAQAAGMKMSAYIEAAILSDNTFVEIKAQQMGVNAPKDAVARMIDALSPKIENEAKLDEQIKKALEHAEPIGLKKNDESDEANKGNEPNEPDEADEASDEPADEPVAEPAKQPANEPEKKKPTTAKSKTAKTPAKKSKKPMQMM